VASLCHTHLAQNSLANSLCVMKTSGNTILITGGSSGIGFEFAKQLLALGNTIIISGRDAQKLAKAKAKLPELHTFTNDVSQTSNLNSFYKEVVSAFPKLNVLINNAGIMRRVNMHTNTDALDQLAQEIDINLKAPIHLSKLFLQHLKGQPEAAIVNVSSGLAFVPLPISPIYCATKAGLHSFTLSLRAQLKHTKVRVFEVAPPATKTELMDSMDASDMKGITIMSVEDMVRESIKGFQNDRLEIRPGPSNQLKFMSRVAPEFILKQLSKPVDRMLTES
jgi:uncharacterized oxidoreductase